MHETASGARSGAAIGIASRSIKLETKMIAKGSDRVPMFGVWVAIGDAYDDRAKSIAFFTTGRKHRGHHRIALTIAQREE